MDRKELGLFGERCAADYLQSQGYRILERNYSCRTGEIDIIACKEEFLVFAEVKLRKNDSFAQGREFVDRAKQKRIIKTAEYWLCQQEETALQPRFDVLEIYAPSGARGKLQINHIENAFM